MLFKTGAHPAGLPALRASGAIRAAGWRAFYVLVVVAGAGLLYGRVLSQPLYWDDARQYYIATENSLAKIWLNQTGYAYYRPAMFTLYKVAFTYLTPAHTYICYAFGLLLHIVGSILMGRLAAELLPLSSASPRHSASGAPFPVAAPISNHYNANIEGAGPGGRGGTEPAPVATMAGPGPAQWLASLLFLTYPFAIYIVGNFAAFQYLVVMLLNVAGALAAIAFARSEGRRRWGIMLAVAIVAPFFHESGAMTGPLLALTVGTLAPRTAWRRRARLAWPVVAAGLYFVIWLALPKGRAEGFGLVSAGDLLSNFSFFMQGLTYPVQQAAGLLRRWHWNDLASVWAAGIPALGLLALASRKTGARILILGAGWFLLASLPSIALLPSWYVVPAPRLLYIVAPPAVLLSVAGCLAAGRLVHARGGKVIAPALGAAILAFSIIFIWGKASLYQVSLVPVRELAELAERYPNQRHLVINPPKWTADVSDPYALGSFGVSILPDYVVLNEVVEINSTAHARFDGVFLPSLYWAESQEARMWGPYREDDPWDTARLAENVLKYDHVWVTTYTPASIDVNEVGVARAGENGEQAGFLANFENQVWLTSGQYAADGQTVTVTLDWLTRTADRDVTVFRHVLDCQGHMLGQADGYPLGRTLPFGYLPAGTRLRDIRTLTLKAPSPDGCYAVEAGLYRLDGLRLAGYTASGSKLPDGAAPIGAAPSR